MNSSQAPQGYSSTKTVVLGSHYATLVSDSVTYENPKGEFTLSYITPHMSGTDAAETKSPVNKENNGLGATDVTESNTLTLVVPRYMFYIMSTHMVANRTPCTHHLAAEARKASSSGTSAGGKIAKAATETAVTVANAFSAPSTNNVVNAVSTLIDTVCVLAGFLGEKSTEVTTEEAVKAATVSPSPDSVTAEAMNSATKSAQGLGDDKAAKAAAIIKSISKLAQSASKASKISTATSIASIIPIILLAFEAGMEIELVKEILGVPDISAIKGTSAGASEAGKTPASEAASEAAAGAAGKSASQIAKMVMEETDKAMKMANYIGSTATKIADSMGLKGVSNVINTATGIASQAAGYVNTAGKVVTSADKLAQVISSDTSSVSEMISAAGGTSAEVAAALGATTVSGLALSAGTTAAQTAAAIQKAVKGTTMTTDTAAAAEKGTKSSAVSSALECAKLVVSEGIKVAQSMGLISSETAQVLGATAGMITSAIGIAQEQAKKENQAEEAGKEAAAKAKEEGKTEEEQAQAASEAAAAKMKELGGTDADIAIACGHLAENTLRDSGLVGTDLLNKTKGIVTTALSIPGTVEKVEQMIGVGSAATAGNVAADKVKDAGGTAEAQGAAAGAAAAATAEEANASKEDCVNAVETATANNLGKGGADTKTIVENTAAAAGAEAAKMTQGTPEAKEAAREEATKQAAANQAAKTQIAADATKEALTEKEEEIKDTSQTTAANAIESGTKLSACAGIGTISPVILHQRKIYYKGQKFLIVNAGGKIDTPCIIGVIPNDNDDIGLGV